MEAKQAARGVTLGEVVDGGERVLVRLDGTAPQAMSVYQVYRFADGKVVRIDGFRERGKALRAAGLAS